MTKKILIVDDSITQRLTLKLKLEKKGYTILEAKNGMEAIKLVYEHNPALVLTDVIMPSINGYHLCRLIKKDKLTEHIPVILLSVLDKKIDKFWGLRAGADGFFCKDDTDEELYGKINVLLSKNVNKSNDEEISVDISSQYDFTSKVAEILDESLVKSTLTNEFRDLSEYVGDDKMFSRKLFSLLTSILDFNLLGVFYNESDKNEKIIQFVQNDADADDNVIEEIRNKAQNAVLSINESKYANFKLGYKISDNDSDEAYYWKAINSIDEYKSELIIPIEDENRILGLLILYHREQSKYVSRNIVDTIAKELKMLFKVKWLYSETKLLSIIDPLTELYNRRYFQQVLDKEFLRSNRYKSPLTVAMIDIDNFKSLNDNYGHQFGDEVLQVVSGIFKESFRKTDYVARYGGEELIAILPETSVAQSIIPIERLRCKIAQQPFMYDFKRIKVTVSIGIAQNNFNFATTDAFIKEADNALYEAKQKGKNRIELATSANRS